MRQKLRALKEYVDILATLIVAIVFAVLGVTGGLKVETLLAMTLAVLAAVTGVLLRQRHITQKTQDTLSELPAAISSLSRIVETLSSNSDYEVLSNENIWDIVEPDGSLAKGTKKKKLRFLRDNVATIYELNRSQGGQSPRIDDWQFEPPMLEKVAEFSSRGNYYVLISLGRLWARDGELEYEATRSIHNLFTDPQNSATTRADEGYDTQRMSATVIWPKGRDPKRVEVEEIEGALPSKQIVYQASELKRDKDGRAWLTHGPLLNPPRGKRIVVTWYW